MGYEDKQRVIKLLNERCYLEAEPILKKILNEDTDDWIIYEGLANVEINLRKNFEEAKALLNKAKEKGQPIDRYHRILAVIYFQQGQHKEEILELEKAVEIEPSIENITTLANSLMEADYERAYPLWLEIIQKEPNNLKANMALSWIYGRKGDYNKALEFAQKALKIDPENATALSYAGKANQDLLQFKEALDYF